MRRILQMETWLFLKRKKKRQKINHLSWQKKAIRNNPCNEPAEQPARAGISVYPNPVTEGMIRVSFNDQPQGRYRISLIDVSGRTVGTREVNVQAPGQVEELRFPELAVKGNYLIRISSEANQISITEKIVVQ